MVELEPLSDKIKLEYKYYMISPFISGKLDWEINKLTHMPENIEHYIETHGAIHPRIAFKMFVQLASAIGKCHSCGITMCVLELSDILIDDLKENIFGINLYDPCAIIYNPLYPQKAWIKKRSKPSIYTAPECTSEVGYDGFPADVYTLGVIFYKMLFGQFPPSNHLSIIEKSIEKSIEWGFDTAHIIAMITLMLDKSPFIRPSILNILNTKFINDLMISEGVNIQYIPPPCMTFPYFYCNPDHIITAIPPFNKPPNFNYFPQTHEIEANYRNAFSTTPSVIEKSLGIYKSYRLSKKELEVAEEKLQSIVYNFLEIESSDTNISEELEILKSKIYNDKIQIIYMSHFLSIKLKEVYTAYNNIELSRKYELKCNWDVIFNRFHGNGYYFFE